MLTFPADKSDFAAPNGVTYAWDDVDEKWRVKAFRSVDDFIVQLEDNPPTDSKEGDLWFDTSDESLTLFVYTGSEWVPATPPVSLDGINATIEAALIVQTDLLARVESGEIIQTGVLDDLTDLQHKVEALEGTVIDGKWYAESRSNPREGGFDITTGGLQSMGDWDADFIRIHKTDTTGKVFTFAEISVGDYIRIGAPASTAVYKITDAPTGSLDWQAFGVELANSTGTPIPDLTYDFEFLPSFDPSAYATIQYVDAQDDLDLKKTGGTITGSLNFQRGDKEHKQFKVAPNGGSDYATNIYNLNGGQMRLRSSHTSSENDHVGSHIVLDPNGGTPETKLYHLAEPVQGHMAVSRDYLDQKIAEALGSLGGGVPVGSIMIWINSDAPDGWFKLHGASFDINTYPLLHAFLQGTNSYTSGKLPDWSGHYPGEYGDHLSASYPALGKKVSQQTAQPSGGAPRSSASIPNGNTRTFNATGGTNAYSDGKSKVSINEGWDDVTRPKTVIVHYIIKHD